MQSPLVLVVELELFNILLNNLLELPGLIHELKDRGLLDLAKMQQLKLLDTLRHDGDYCLAKFG